MNNRYKIKVKDPLLMPGLSIETEVSEKYVVVASTKLMDMVRDINNASIAGGEKQIMGAVRDLLPKMENLVKPIVKKSKEEKDDHEASATKSK